MIDPGSYDSMIINYKNFYHIFIESRRYIPSALMVLNVFCRSIFRPSAERPARTTKLF